MPFRGVIVMDQKRRFVEFAATEGPSVRRLCRRFGISPTAGNCVSAIRNGGGIGSASLRERFFMPWLRFKS